MKKVLSTSLGGGDHDKNHRAVYDHITPKNQVLFYIPVLFACDTLLSFISFCFLSTVAITTLAKIAHFSFVIGINVLVLRGIL